MLKTSGIEPVPGWADKEVWEMYKAEKNKDLSNPAYRMLSAADPFQDRFYEAKKLDWEGVDEKIGVLADKIKKNYRPDLLIGIAKGGALYVGRLAEKLDIDPEDPQRVARMKISHYRNILGRTGMTQTIPWLFAKARTESSPKNYRNEKVNLNNMKVILADDDPATGKTLTKGKGFCEKEMVDEVKSGTLFGCQGIPAKIRNVIFRNDEPDFFADPGAYAIYPWYQI